MQTEPFRGVSQASSDWFPVGRASSFPDLISQPLLCKGDATPGCKVFHIPQQDASQGAQVPIADIGMDLKDQVLVFRFRGQFHAIDHSCPHSSYPLSQGILFDIEDFGVTLSAGISCPKHNWSFDLFSGMSDRGGYKLPLWEIQLREAGEGTNVLASPGNTDSVSDVEDKEVWVRRKPRVG
ncbi:rieske domain-containing protein [Coniochaeta sp. PMI_546]|nr:rieske domain-containing protein [Coniochaeta sp. PMI_546]